MTRFLVLLLAATLALGCTASLAADAPGSSPPQSVAQPEKVPGNWKITPQPFPAIEDIVKAPPPALPVYGLYIWTGEYKNHRESVKKVGWKSLRIGGPFDDESMKFICQDGLEVMKTLGLWNVAGATGKKNRADYDSDEKFVADYVAGVEAFLTRYGPDGTFFKDNPDVPNRPILHVEIWNEPNFQYMIPDRQPRAEVEKEREALYAKILPATYAAVKKKWPTVEVVGFGAGGASAGDLRFIQHVFEQNSEAIGKSFDILATHPYQPPCPPEVDEIKSWGSYSTANSLKKIRDTLAKNGVPNKPIWYTEIGWPVSQADGGYFKTPENGVFATPLLQAAYVCREYALAMRLGVSRVHIMFATDTDNFNGGFFLRDMSWRPSAYAVQNMIRLMPNPVLQSAISDGVDGYYAYRFAPSVVQNQRPVGPVIMAWNVAGPKTVEIPWNTMKATIVDMFGNRTEAASEGGKLKVDIGPCPVYVLPN